MDIFYNEVEVRDCGTIKLECLNFTLQKIINSKIKLSKDRKWKIVQEELKYYLVPKCCLCATICQIGCLRNLALGTSWIHLALHIHFIVSTK
jgi:hypothetical protein